MGLRHDESPSASAERERHPVRCSISVASWHRKILSGSSGRDRRRHPWSRLSAVLDASLSLCSRRAGLGSDASVCQLVAAMFGEGLALDRKLRCQFFDLNSGF